jgi:hypothetical protein
MDLNHRFPNVTGQDPNRREKLHGAVIGKADI